MKLHPRAGAALLIFWTGLHAPALNAAEAPRMGKAELRPMLGSPEVIVIDVRSYTDWVFSRSKIQGAMREDYRDFGDWKGKYPRDKTLVLYCA